MCSAYAGNLMNLLNSCINGLVNLFFRIFITLQMKIVKSSSKFFYVSVSKGQKLHVEKLFVDSKAKQS